MLRAAARRLPSGYAFLRMTVTELWITNAGLITAMMLTLWGVSLPLRNASIVDIAWGAGFAVIGATSAVLGEGLVERRWLGAVLACVWGLRLGGYLAWRNLGHGEDRRYQAMRRGHGRRFWWVSLFTVFLLQGALMLVIGLPLMTIAASSRPLDALAAAGVGLWLVGLVFESVADVQLARFKANPQSAGRVLDRGLWRYSRHPNYFGDFCVWWGIFVVAAPDALFAVVSPLLMTTFLLRVSGVALLERTIVERRPAYRSYIARTSAFFPWPPRRAE